MRRGRAINVTCALNFLRIALIASGSPKRYFRVIAKHLHFWAIAPDVSMAAIPRNSAAAESLMHAPGLSRGPSQTLWAALSPIATIAHKSLAAVRYLAPHGVRSDVVHPSFVVFSTQRFDERTNFVNRQSLYVK
ncbi:hypothetical protein D9M72_484710 [compost metagenome]